MQIKNYKLKLLFYNFILKMKAETVFNVAIHLSVYELQRLNNLITDKLNLNLKKY
jgi:hypothetical protein